MGWAPEAGLAHGDKYMFMLVAHSGCEKNPSAFDLGSLISVDWGSILSHDLGVAYSSHGSVTSICPEVEES